MLWFLLISTVLLLSVVRVYAIRPNQRKKNPRRSGCTLAVFLGSGGHTSEALTLMSALDFQRYTRRIYLVSEGDILSARKALDLEAKAGEARPNHCHILTIPRARKVHQSLLTTPFSAAKSLAFCVYQLMVVPASNMGRAAFADVLILNGPGTCFILCLAVYINKFFGVPAPKVIYVETFARVKSLSLSAKLVRPLADCFVTQWPSVQKPLDSNGWLV